MSWEVIDHHRLKARQKRFDILIWGPSSNDKELYPIRIKIKDYLNQEGHSAKFSEDLLLEGKNKSAPDPIIDEFFHADAAKVIIILYRSRGTQTEFDRILRFERFSRKSLILVEENLWNEIITSISNYSWRNLKNIQRVDVYNEYIVLNLIKDFIEKLQFSEYIRDLELELLNKN